jgi:CRP/FNR family transcriptional regulator, cyclic AMP receptor protein
MARNSYHDQLRKVPLFADLDRADLDRVGQVSTELQIPAGEHLMREGELAHEMFVVLDGTLEVTRDGQPVATIGPGDFAGEMALLTRAARNSTVTATSDVRVLHIDGRAFGELLHKAPHIAVTMLPIVARRASPSGH